MGIFKKIFGIFRVQRQNSLSGRAQEMAKYLIIRKYRQLADINNCAPTSKTTDQTILDIYDRVVAAFNQVAESKNERIPAVNMNSIVFKFVQVYEMTGENHFEQHLKYEIDKYINEGLRPDYLQQEINLF